MNKYEELIYSLIINCNREITKEEKEILNQASAIYNTYNNLTKELGCPLEVLVKALKEGIYQADGGRRKYPTIEYNGATKKFYFAFGTYCNVEDYGKEWFLREDKSE